MSVYGLMRTSTSGMTAQSDRLSTIADNIANSNTVGYKGGSTRFSTLVVSASPRAYEAGAVESLVRYDISRQGAITASASQTDLAIEGAGFFLVGGRDNSLALTRAGSFVRSSDGELVNSSGYRLLGYELGSNAGAALNGTAGLVPIQLGGGDLNATPTSKVSLAANFPSSSPTVGGALLPSTNGAGAAPTGKASVVVYDNLGASVLLDVHYAKTATPGQWEVAVYDAAGRSASGGFPYASPALGVTNVQFDSNGKLDPAGPSSLTVAVPNGVSAVFDLAGSTQLAADFQVSRLEVNGNAPLASQSLEFAADGTVYDVFADGSRRASYRVPLAGVGSPDLLRPVSGTMFELTLGSGPMKIGAAGQGGLGSLKAGALERSNVDLAGELTEMVEAQRNYTANSKVFQTGAELLEVLVNLKR